MIATHNIKVNGTWYKAGEEYEVEQPLAVEEPVKEETVAEPEEPVAAPAAEEPKASPKARAASTRRKGTGK